MRQIKFRAWDVSNKKWLLSGFPWAESTQVDESFATFRIDNGVVNTGDAEFEVHVMQFTGLLDKNGVECYEGDKIQQGDTTYTVSWNDEYARFFPFEMLTENEWEIIGNIYEDKR